MNEESEWKIDTPALLLDLDIMETNLAEIADFAGQAGVVWRPHVKTHKSIAIAKQQMEFGAVGITVAKLSEAEVMANAGIDNILVAYPISGEEKLQRLLSLAAKAHIIAAVDSIEQAALLNNRFEANGLRLEVWIKVNSGLNRCGVEPGEEAVSLAKYIVDSMPSLQLTGLFTHAGHAYSASSPEEVEKIALMEAESILKSAEMCHKQGIQIIHRSVGSTPTFRKSGMIPGITEVRPGNAVFFDAIQVGLGVTTFDRCALTVRASVIGTYSNRVVFDAGSKTLSLDKGAHGNETVKGFGHILQHPHVILDRLSEEHGVATGHYPDEFKLSDTVDIIPNHACTVINLFDTVLVTRQGRIVDEWTIDARGKIR